MIDLVVFLREAALFERFVVLIYRGVLGADSDGLGIGVKVIYLSFESIKRHQVA